MERTSPLPKILPTVRRISISQLVSGPTRTLISSVTTRSLSSSRTILGTSNHTVDLNITPIEDTARIDGDTEEAGQEDNTITGNLKAVDPDGLTDSTYFSIEITDQARHGSAVIDPTTGDWVYTPKGFLWR